MKASGVVCESAIASGNALLIDAQFAMPTIVIFAELLEELDGDLAHADEIFCAPRAD